MEKEKLSSELQKLVGENSLSDRTWNEYIDNSVIPFLPTEQEKVSDYLSKHADALKSINGQLNFDVASKVNDFKKNYKPDTLNPQTKPPHLEQKNSNDDPSSALADTIAKINQFMEDEEKRRNNESKAAFQRQMLSDAKEIAKNQGAVDDVIVGLILPKISISETDTNDSIAKAIKAEYDKVYSELHGRGYTPAGNSSGNNATNSFKAYKERKQKEGKLPIN